MDPSREKPGIAWRTYQNIFGPLVSKLHSDSQSDVRTGALFVQSAGFLFLVKYVITTHYLFSWKRLLNLHNYRIWTSVKTTLAFLLQVQFASAISLLQQKTHDQYLFVVLKLSAKVLSMTYEHGDWFLFSPVKATPRGVKAKAKVKVMTLLNLRFWECIRVEIPFAYLKNRYNYFFFWSLIPKPNKIFRSLNYPENNLRHLSTLNACYTRYQKLPCSLAQADEVAVNILLVDANSRFDPAIFELLLRDLLKQLALAGSFLNYSCRIPSNQRHSL